MSDCDEGETPYPGVFCSCGLYVGAARSFGSCQECGASWPTALVQRSPYDGGPPPRWLPAQVEMFAERPRTRAGPDPDAPRWVQLEQRLQLRPDYVLMECGWCRAQIGRPPWQQRPLCSDPDCRAQSWWAVVPARRWTAALRV